MDAHWAQLDPLDDLLGPGPVPLCTSYKLSVRLVDLPRACLYTTTKMITYVRFGFKDFMKSCAKSTYDYITKLCQEEFLLNLRSSICCALTLSFFGWACLAFQNYYSDSLLLQDVSLLDSIR
eukprot:280229-Amphidinium_carterae.1